MSIRRRNLRAFDVERFLKAQSVRHRTLFESSERSTSKRFLKAQSVQRRNLRAFDVERFLKALSSNLRQRLLSNP